MHDFFFLFILSDTIIIIIKTLSEKKGGKRINPQLYLFIWSFDCSPFIYDDNTQRLYWDKRHQKLIHCFLLFIIPEEFYLIHFYGEYYTWLPSQNVHVQYSFDSSLLIVILSFSKVEGPWNWMHELSQFSIPFIFFILCHYQFGELLSAPGFMTPFP